MTSVSHVTAMYATKRRRRNSKNVKPVSKDIHTKSNPSKRHRERLNQELDTLASLLPFEQNVLSKLDKLSILRLSVSYLRTKSYFQAALSGTHLSPVGSSLRSHTHSHSHSHSHNNNHHSLSGTRQSQTQQTIFGQHQFGPTNIGQSQLDHQSQHQTSSASSSSSCSIYPPELRIEGDLIVQALNGFLLILTCDGEVFYASHTVEAYLGFHQSDICHQSVYELVHSEDREELTRQLKWNSMISESASSNLIAETQQQQQQQQQHSSNGKSSAQLSLKEVLESPEHRNLLERNFTVRFRCLLDNTSGFLRLDIRGRIKVLHGQQNQHNLANSAGIVNETTTNTNNSTGNIKRGNRADSVQIGNVNIDGQAEPMLAFFGVCIPFGPPALLEMPTKDSVFKSKHRLDMSLISLDSRGRQLLGLNELCIPNKAPSSVNNYNNNSPERKKTSSSSSSSSTLLASNTGSINSASATAGLKQSHNLSAYDLVHQDDLSYMASAHQELLKTGASGLIAYRVVTQPEGKLQWLQTSAKLYYKNSKPDFILCTHRPLMEEEGRDLLGKRTMDFKVTFLDIGFSTINDRIMACDKFSSFQTLSCVPKSSSESPANGSSARNNNNNNNNNNSNNNNLISSPTLSGTSTRSTASLSPQSSLSENTTNQQTASNNKSNNKANLKRSKNMMMNYDLGLIQGNGPELTTNNQQQQQQQLDNNYMTTATTQQQQYNHQQLNSSFDSNGPYKRSQTGEVYFDLDSIDGPDLRKYSTSLSADTNGPHHINMNPKKKISKQSNTNYKTSTTTNKRDLNQQQQASEAINQPDHLMTSASKQKAYQTNKDDLSMHHHNQQQQQQQQYSHQQHQHQHQYHQQSSQYNHQASAVDTSQLHLYTQYGHSHNDTDSTYPASQAAAAYAAVATQHHQNHAHSHHHNPYGSAINHHLLTYGNHHHHHHAHPHHHPHPHHQGSQSLYGSPAVTQIVSPSSATGYTAHHQQTGSGTTATTTTPFAHNLDGSASSHRYSNVGHYGSLTGTSASAHQHQAAHQIGSTNSNQQTTTGTSSNYPSSASQSSFLPAEHLLHHYSQSAAARNAALAAWQPQSGGSVTNTSLDYHGVNSASVHNLSHTLAVHHSIAPTPTDYASGSTAAAAISLVANTTTPTGKTTNTSNGADLVKRETNTSPSFSPSRASVSLTEGNGYVSASNNNNTSSNNERQQHYNHSPSSLSITDTRSSPKASSTSSKTNNASTNNSNSNNNNNNLTVHRLNQALQKSSATTISSLGSDGSLHRSPLSSGESSNGSAGASIVANAVSIISNSALGSSAATMDPVAYYGLTSSDGQHGSQLSVNQQEMQARQVSLHGPHTHHHSLSSYHQNPYAAAAAVAHQYATDANYHQHHVGYHHSQHHQAHTSLYSSDQHEASNYFQHSDNELAMVGSSAAVVGAGMKMYGGSNECYRELHQLDNVQRGQNFGHRFSCSSIVSENFCSDESINHNEKWTNPVGVDDYGSNDKSNNTAESEQLVTDGNTCPELVQEEETKEDSEDRDKPNNGDNIIGNDEDIRDPLTQLISSTIGDISIYSD